MGVVRSAGSWLPDPLVGKVPVLRNILSKADQDFLRGAVEVSMALCILGRGFYHFAVNIKLKLMSCAVPNAYRPGIEIARKVQFFFARSHPTENVIQDVQSRLGQPRGMQHPGHETFCFFDVTKAQKRTHGQRCVTQPTVPIVPVKAAANPRSEE